MTKTARVITIFFLVFVSLIYTDKIFAGFEDLLKPIPENDSPTANDQLPTTNPPSVTFGDLLNIATPSPEVTPVAADEAQIASKTAQFKKLLTQLEESYQESLAQFKEKEQTLPVNDRTINDASGNFPSPTPYIPARTLIAGVSELANINSATVFPTPTLTEQLLLVSLNNASSLPPQIYNPQPTPTIFQSTIGTLTQNPVKNTYTIALLGDSMTDTLGKDLPHLRNLLQSAYPNNSFGLLNYGQGATDLESGLYRLTNKTTYLGTDYPPLLTYKPDILVVESFAYNHWSGEKYDLDRQWLDFAKIIDTVKQNSPETKIVFAATIAPNKHIFGDGALNWPKALKEQSSLIIKAYLQNMVNFATSQHYPLADAYHPSLESDGEGVAGYINSSDHLHPSGDGAYLYSMKILEAIKANNLINTQ